MKYIVATDSRGYKRRFLVRDSDGDEDALMGIPSGPPDLDRIDWDSLKKVLNDGLAERGLWTWDEIQTSPEGISFISSTVKQWVSSLFREDKAIAKKASQRQHS